ncbi:Na+/H+ antiporter NhaC family protein [Paraprevotella clara]|uniref:Na+/H+ antiporter NhaC family protein n=1 Tax=Paraprevotella clara TaxID=454154 RepID=UPI003AB5503B
MSINGKSVAAISPLLVFVVLYLVTSIIVRDFYKVPITVAFMVSSVYAVATMRGVPLEERVKVYSQGAGSPNLMLMIWIFILAGAFAASAKAMGAIDATVNLSLRLLPDNLLLGGIFLAACFISLSIGTSVGTIVALTPLAAGIARETGAGLPLLVAIVAGGAFFGDNLSFISDTTITATRTQGCKLSDKFKVNSQIVMPAAAIAFALYIFMGVHIHAPQQLPEVDWIKVVPYLVVLITAVVGVNVMVVLVLGLVLSGVVGVFTGTYDLFGWFAAMGEGITGMGELIIITMMAGGLMEIIRYNGGIDYILHALTRHIRSKRGAELSIAALVSVINLCTANNTVAIITAGPLAHDIAGRYGVDKRKSASILDTFSCFTQGLIPYGAQLLMAAGLASINPIDIIPYLYYPFIMGACALLSILFRYPRKYS